MTLLPRYVALLSGCVLFCAVQIQAATYYVATNGSDSNSGTESSPWASIAYAATRINDGDTVRVKPGTYYETGNVKIRDDDVIFMADDPNNRPTIDFQDRYNASGNFVEAYNCNDGLWDGINILNAGANGRGAFEATNWNSTDNPTPITGWTIRNCTIQYAHNAAIKIRHCNNVLIENVDMLDCAQMNADRKNTNNHPHILLGAFADYVTVRNCKILRGHGEGVGPYNSAGNWVIENCEIADNYVINVYVDTQEGNTTVRNNLIYNTGYYVAGGTSNQVADGIRVANEVSDYGGWGAFYDPSQYLVENVNIYNNVIINCRGGIAIFRYAWLGQQGPFELHNSLIANNTIVGTVDGAKGIRVTAPGTNTIVRDNIVYNTGGLEFDNSVNDYNNYTSDPGFVDGTGFVAENYRLTQNSPCIDNASSNTLFTTDYWGTARPQGSGWDVGAHEFALSLTGFAAWASANSITSGPQGDSDEDGTVNFVEYALDLNPAENSMSGMPTVVKNGNNYDFSFNDARNGVVYQVEISDNLQAWNAYGNAITGDSSGNTTVSIPKSAVSGNSLFIRLSMTE